MLHLQRLQVAIAMITITTRALAGVLRKICVLDLVMCSVVLNLVVVSTSLPFRPFWVPTVSTLRTAGLSSLT